VTPLEARLADLAAQGQTITYGELARGLGLSGLGTIRQLTDALEALMAIDKAAGQPFRAALCCARLSDGLPAPGFFDTARRLGCRIGDPAAFVADERAALFVPRL
jgi:hypothetical protein